MSAATESPQMVQSGGSQARTRPRYASETPDTHPSAYGVYLWPQIPISGLRLVFQAPQKYF